MAKDLAGRIERELRKIGAWTDTPPSEGEVLAGGAFGMNSVPFVWWIQVVLLARLHRVATGEMELPGNSSIATFAVREFDGTPEHDKLFHLLVEVDHLF